jgi:hypothetical protein
MILHIVCLHRKYITHTDKNSNSKNLFRKRKRLTFSQNISCEILYKFDLFFSHIFLNLV